MAAITVVGGGLAGMVAAIAAAEQGAKVHLYEAHHTLGGRARSSSPPFVANDGPHALYDNGAFWPWLAERDLIGRPARVPLGALAGFQFRWQGKLCHRPPAAVLRLLAKRNRTVPVDRDFRGWVAAAHGEQAATAVANLLGMSREPSGPSDPYSHSQVRST